MPKKKALIFVGMVYLWLAGGTLGVGAASDVRGQELSSVSSSRNFPVLELGESSYDFGEVPEGDVVSHDFIVKNTGKGELKINKVSPD